MAHYLVFVDETFDGFMNLPSLDGHFLYTALMLPASSSDQLSYFFASTDRWLKQQYQAATGVAVTGEFKSTYFTQLTENVKAKLCQKISRFLHKNKGYVAGFYTSVHSLLCWHIRSEAGGENFAELPPYTPELIDKQRERLRDERKKEFGESAILKGLLHTIAGIPQSWFAHLGHTYELIYDSRNKKEDRLILAPIDDFMPRMKNVGIRYDGVYVGSKSVEGGPDQPGLLLADWICKELRNYFFGHHELLSESSAFELISPTSHEGETIFTSIAGHPMKWGSAKAMQPSTTEKFSKIAATPFGHLQSSLADMKLSCYAHFGESRIIDLRAKVFSDMVD